MRSKLAISALVVASLFGRRRSRRADAAGSGPRAKATSDRALPPNRVPDEISQDEISQDEIRKMKLAPQPE